MFFIHNFPCLWISPSEISPNLRGTIMYILPRRFKCDQCEHEQKYSPHHDHGAPVFDEGPICPKCFESFVRTNCGLMRAAALDEAEEGKT